MTTPRKFEGQTLDWWASLTEATVLAMDPADRLALRSEALGICEDIERYENEQQTTVSYEPYTSVLRWTAR